MPATSPPTFQPVTVATYNIHRTLGSDGRCSPGRIADVILGLDAHLVALQEVETPAKPAHRALLRQLEDAGYETLLGPTIRAASHHYGNALLTQLPVLACTRLDLSVPNREPRGLIDARLDLALLHHGPPDSAPAPELRCLATHLGLSGAERRAQIARIVERIDGPGDGTTPGPPLVLLGDFNEWWPRRLRPFSSRLRFAPVRVTWPSRSPLLALDRIFYRNLRLQASVTDRSPLSRLASDHLPLRAQFRIPDAATSSRARSS